MRCKVSLLSLIYALNGYDIDMTRCQKSGFIRNFVKDACHKSNKR